MLYLPEHFATAVLESVVHMATTAPPPAHAQWVTITDEVAVLELNAWTYLQDGMSPTISPLLGRKALRGPPAPAPA